MILECDQVASDYDEIVDVVVIGSGCGGATAGKILAQAGFSVLMLERGGYYTAQRGDLDQRGDNMLARIDGGRGLHTSANGEIALMHGNCVGGASVHYWGDSWRLPRDRSDLYERMGVSGHDHEEMAPIFEQIERELNIHVHGPEFHNRMNQLFDVGARELGWHVEGVPQARRGCQGSGHCYQGCAVDAKQSMLVTYVPAFLAAGGRLFADCEVETIATNAGGRANGVVARFLDRRTGRSNGYKARVSARAVVLAAGGFTSAVIWLKSKLSDRAGLVGKGLLCNPNPYLYALFDEPIVLWQGPPACTGTMDFRLPRLDGAGDYLEGGYLLHPNQLQPEFLAATLPGFGGEHRALMSKLDHVGGAVSWIDDEIGGDIRLDEGGAPAYEYAAQGVDLLKARDALKKQAQLLFAAGAREVIVPDIAGTRLRDPARIGVFDTLDIQNGAILFGAPHPSSALRMGDDPRRSVVASSHEAHEVPGLFVADPSVFPRGPSVDPSETIMAWSHVAAQSVLHQLGMPRR